jgi:GntR family transcriptional regulator
MTRKGPMPLALYHQIYMILREQLLNGAFPVGQAIPSEIALAEQYSVSRVTIRSTLEKLENEGLISREKGRGTFPKLQHEVVTKPAPSDLRGFLDNLVELGRRTKAEVLEFEYTVPPPNVTAALHIPVGSVVQRSTRLYSNKGAVFGYVTAYVREDLGRTFTQADAQKGPYLPLMEKAGISPGRVEQSVTAVLAPPHVATLLEVPIGSALISLERVVFDQDDRPIDVNYGLYRPDRYNFQINLERPGSADKSPGSDAEQWTTAANSARPKASVTPR